MSKRTQLTFREWILLFLLLIVGTGVGFYYWLLAPLTALSAAVRTDLVLAEQQLSERREWQARDAATIASLQTLAQEQAILQAELDAISHEQAVIDYLVALSQRTGCSISSLEIVQEQLTLSVSARAYGQIRTFLNDIEQSPNLVPVTATIAANQNVLNLQLQAQLTFGQLTPDNLQAYPRTIPFGR